MMGNILPKRFALTAFLQTLRLKRRLKTRQDLLIWQDKQIARWLKDGVAKVDYYRNHDISSLKKLPIVDKQTMMNAFEAFNQPRIKAETIRTLLQEQKQIPGYTIGMSTGTSGNRTLYIISEKERFQWLGVILAKLLPSYPRTRARIAVALPTATPLYQSANHLWRLKLQFFDLNKGLGEVAADLSAYQPDTLIAPPHLLAYLADNNVKLPLKRIFSGAEVLDPCDREKINAHFGVALKEIYMASEGLLATPCSHGKLHLCEDVMHFSFEPVGNDGLVTPIITDFVRRTEIMARYRMNDILRLSNTPCPCGSPLQVVEEVIGRMDDVFPLKSRSGQIIPLTPDIMRNTVLDASPAIQDFRLLYETDGTIRLALPADIDNADAQKAQKALSALLKKLNVEAPIHLELKKLTSPQKGKLRRIENRNRS